MTRDCPPPDAHAEADLRVALRVWQQEAAIGALAAHFAHGGNNRLTVILSCLDMLAAADAQPGERRDLLDLALGSARHLADDLKAMLVCARTHAEPAEVVDLADEVLAARRVFNLMCERPLQIDVAVGDGLAVKAERRALQRAMVRLFDLAERSDATCVNIRGGRLQFDARVPDLPALRRGSYCWLDFRVQGMRLPERWQAASAAAGSVIDRLRERGGLEIAAVEAFIGGLRGQLVARDHPEGGTTIRLFVPATAPSA